MYGGNVVKLPEAICCVKNHGSGFMPPPDESRPRSCACSCWSLCKMKRSAGTMTCIPLFMDSRTGVEPVASREAMSTSAGVFFPPRPLQEARAGIEPTTFARDLYHAPGLFTRGHLQDLVTALCSLPLSSPCCYRKQEPYRVAAVSGSGGSRTRISSP